MKFMIIVRANEVTEGAQMPDTELLAEMGKFNEALVDAGVMLSGEGLLPTAMGARVKFEGTKRTVARGPFDTEVAGFWIWQCKSLEDAIEWVKRIPNPTGAESTVEIRRVAEAEDFGEALTPELRENEQRLGERLRAQQAR